MTNEKKRQNTVAEILNNSADPGRIGRAFEIMCARENSRKTTVAKQNETDVYVKFSINGKIRYIPAECKTTGGRIGSLLDGSNKAKYVIYSLDFIQKHKATKTRPEWEEHRHIDPVIIPTAIFIAKLRELNAIKAMRRDGELDGDYAIQPSNKRWFEWLSEWPVEFNREWTYEECDFEGLGL